MVPDRWGWLNFGRACLVSIYGFLVFLLVWGYLDTEQAIKLGQVPYGKCYESERNYLYLTIFDIFVVSTILFISLKLFNRIFFWSCLFFVFSVFFTLLVGSVVFCGFDFS